MTLTIFNTEVRQISVNAIPYSLSLCSRTNEVFNLSFTVNESPMSLVIDCYDFHGSKSSSFILTDASKVRLRFTNFSKIIFTDATNNYPIYVSLQSILAQTENEFAELLLQQEFTIEDLTANNLAKQEQLLLLS